MYKPDVSFKIDEDGYPCVVTDGWVSEMFDLSEKVWKPIEYGTWFPKLEDTETSLERVLSITGGVKPNYLKEQ